MSSPSSSRRVRLIDAGAPGRPYVEAVISRDYPAAELDRVETVWAAAREAAATAGRAEGLAPLEHEHWDWRNKADSVEVGRHMLVAVECGGSVQGLMAVLRTPRPGRAGAPVVYVDYLEAAPWNLKNSVDLPRYYGVGTVLIAEAIRISLGLHLGGRVGLHSLPQAEPFYQDRCRMTRFGADPDYYDLTYFEYTGPQAADWLADVEGAP